LIFGLVFVCYGPALNGGVLWDDPAHLTRPDLRTWDGLWRIWTELRATQQYYPVLFSAFWIEHRLWGDHTLGYHLVNVVLHATSACLLAGVLRRLWAMPHAPVLRPAPVSYDPPAGAEWFAAAVFAVHPVCVESVAWISEQKNTLSLMFYLLAAWSYLGFTVRRRARCYGLATALFLLAVGSKTATVTLPAALLVILWWKQGRIGWRRDVVPLLPWFGVAVAMGLFTSWFERRWIGAEGAEFALSAMERVLLAGRILWFYVGQLLWPTELSFFYLRWDVAAESGGWIGYLVAAIAVTIGLWMFRTRARGPLAGWLLFAGSLFPALGFFNVYPFLFSYVADHFQYLPSLGAIAAVTAGGAAALVRGPEWLRRWGAVACVGVIVVLAVAARRQSALYQDNETLFRATVARTPSAWMAHQILASTLAKTPGRQAEAIEAYREVLRLKPDHPDAHFGLGVELARLPGKKDEAMLAYQRAIELRPAFAEAHHALALELARQPGRLEEAVTHLEAALRAKPRFAEAHASLADLLVKSPRRLPEAMAHYQEALHLNPNLAWVHCRLAFQLAQLPGRQSEALAHYHTALRIEPDYIDAHNGLAIAYLIMGQPAEARREWETVLRIDPTQEAARRNLRRLDEEERR
jgi:tetratricopeptide (TPR) repeat protein